MLDILHYSLFLGKNLKLHLLFILKKKKNGREVINSLSHFKQKESDNVEEFFERVIQLTIESKNFRVDIHKKCNNKRHFLFEYHMNYCTNYNIHTHQINDYIYN